MIETQIENSKSSHGSRTDANGSGGFSNMAHVATSRRLESTHVRLGIIPLTDCAPIVCGVEKSFFAKQGLTVELSVEASWSSIRDKVGCGMLDGAHMLAGMPIASTLGIGTFRSPTVTAFSMDLNGNAITVSNALYEAMNNVDPRSMERRQTSVLALKKLVDRRRRQGKRPLRFGMVFPVSMHNYELRYWLASAGIDPDLDVRLDVIPPPMMVDLLERGEVDGFCVGEPWNSLAVHRGIGRVLISKHEIWNNSPEKVLGVRKAWADAHPNTHQALVRGMIEAAQWLDDPDHRVEAAGILNRPGLLSLPSNVLEASLGGRFKYGNDDEAERIPDFHLFFRNAATFPWRSHAVWILSQMKRWGQLPDAVDIQNVIESVYDCDLYRAAANDVGVASPLVDFKPEGLHYHPWILEDATSPIEMGPDSFFDGKVFDFEAGIAALNSGQNSSRPLGRSKFPPSDPQFGDYVLGKS